MYRAALVARCLRGKPARRFALISRPWGAFRLGANIVSACPSVMPRREAQKHLGAAKLRFLAAPIRHPSQQWCEPERQRRQHHGH